MEGSKVSKSSEKTFTAYTNDQGAVYARARSDYHPNIYKRIIDHHVSTGGQLGTLVDVGCGPGNVARALAPRFENAVGFDPSQGMIVTARQLGGVSANGRSIVFERSTAEDLGRSAGTTTTSSTTTSGDNSIVPDGTADLIVAATAAHWFDMSGFWPRAAQLLRPGGTVAIWTGERLHDIHPSIPNAEAISAALLEIHDREILPFMVPGNVCARNLYVDLPLPWNLTPSPVREFDQSSFFRKEWGTAGQDDDGDDVDGREFFATGQKGYSMDMLELAVGTVSPITRWRQANPDKVGTEDDVVRRMRRQVERLLHEAGVPEGEEVVKGKTVGVLIMVKKAA